MRILSSRPEQREKRREEMKGNLVLRLGKMAALAGLVSVTCRNMFVCFAGRFRVSCCRWMTRDFRGNTLESRFGTVAALVKGRCLKIQRDRLQGKPRLIVARWFLASAVPEPRVRRCEMVWAVSGRIWLASPLL
jgi:hypothetical protein